MELSDDNRKKFDKFLMDNLYSRQWCTLHKINYIKPNIKIAKEKTYYEIINLPA